MKIRLLIANAHGGAGTGRTVINQANALAELHDVEIISVRGKGQRTAFPLSPKVTLRNLVNPAARWPKLASHAPSLLAHPLDRRYEIFNPATDLALARYLHSVPDGALMGTRPALNLAIARWAKPGVVRVAQEHMHLNAHREGLRAAIKTYYPRLDAVVTLTEDDATAYRTLLGDATRVEWVPNGVVLADAQVSPQTDRSIVAVGRLVPQKGYDRLVDAFAAVAPKHPDWSLTIWGRGPLREDLQRQIDTTGLGDRVRLGGFTRDISSELARSSVFAMSSRREGLPMSMLEAMGSGLAMVSFDCPTGPRDLIDDEVDGLLVPEGDVPGLAAALDRVMDDEALRRRLGAAARTKADRYGTGLLAGKWDELLRELAAAHPARRADGVRRRRRPAYLPGTWIPVP